MGRLVAIEARGRTFVDALRAAWERGDAVLPLDPRLPATAAERLQVRLRAGEPVDDGTALVVPTSGTTGEPKGVVLSHDAVAASAHATSDRLGIDPSAHTWLACLPLAHVGGLSVVTRALALGTGLVVHDRFDAAAVDAAAQDGATHVSLVATALARIDATAWQTIVLGGAAPPLERPPNTVATYGMTETGSGVVYDGVPLDGVEVRTVDGVLHLRGPMLSTRYRSGESVLDADGWLRTGDRGEWDGKTVVVHGREGDLIITGGENVWPDPVERRLRTHPAVGDVAVVGRPDREWGQRVEALVVPADPATPPSLDELRGWVREMMPAFAAPKTLVLVDEIPRTSLGKTIRTAL